MSQQTEEWDDMTQQQKDEIRAGFRLAAAVADVDRADLRARLTRASRSGLAARLAQIPTI